MMTTVFLGRVGFMFVRGLATVLACMGHPCHAQRRRVSLDLDVDAARHETYVVLPR